MSTFSIISIVALMIEGHHALVTPPSQRPLHQTTTSRHNNYSSSLSSSLLDSSSDQPRRVKIRARAVSKGSSGGGSSGQRSATLTRPKSSRKSKTDATSTSPPVPVASSSTSNEKEHENKPAGKTKSTGNKLHRKSKKKEDEQPIVYYKRKPTRHTKSGAPFQHQEMMDHTILNKEEEIMYGRQVVRARELREQIESVLEERRIEREMRRLEMEEMDLVMENDSDEEGSLDYDFLSYELEYLSVYGYRPSEESKAEDNDSPSSASSSSLGGFDLEDDLLIDHAQHRSHHISQLTGDPSTPNFVPTNKKSGPKRNGYRNGSTSLQSSRASSSSTTGRNSYSPLLHIPIHELSEHDVVHALDIPGGKSQLVDVLLEGAYARETLMRRNVKLVMSIAKNWMRNSFSTANANLGSAGGGAGRGGLKGGKNDKGTRKFLAEMYEGSWDRPSLDEAVQEGMLGLARAVDKYDPERGLRFSTYATHWITSYVRISFQRAVTGCLRVPSQLHDIKAAYNKILKDHLHLGSDPPAQESIAQQLGISAQRLRSAIRATGGLLSVDAPVMSGSGSGSYKGSMAGGDGSNSQELLILDTLKW